MAEPVALSEMVWAANRTVDMHWLRPGESWRPGRCADCTDVGCARLESAEAFLAQVRDRALS
jgi:hypothetical protein